VVVRRYDCQLERILDGRQYPTKYIVFIELTGEMETVGFAGVPRSSTTAQLLESSITELFYLRYTTGNGNSTALLSCPQQCG